MCGFAIKESFIAISAQAQFSKGAAAATGIAAVGLNPFAPRPARADDPPMGRAGPVGVTSFAVRSCR
jgi:hypothetical protein